MIQTNSKSLSKSKSRKSSIGSKSKSIPTRKSKTKSIPRFLRRIDIPECIREDNLAIEVRNKQREKKISKIECDNKRFSFISQYFNEEKASLSDLLYALYKMYHHELDKDIDFIITFREFIDLFPRDTALLKQNFRKQHVFEAMCKLLLLFNYDNNHWGQKKIFYKSLETFTKGHIQEETQENILNEKLNTGSSAQSVDIFFKIPGIRKDDHKERKTGEPACLIDYTDLKSGVASLKNKDLFILIQNKYYDTEKSAADKYDINKIATRAKDLTNEMFEEVNKKIVLMVNNKQELEEKINRVSSRNTDFTLVDEIFGMFELQDWFQSLLFDIRQASTFEKFKEYLGIKGRKNKPNIQLRFHQELIVKTTNTYLNQEKREDKRKKFIWGAVPRSGKSFMIAGMIAQRGITPGSENNDIILILGAKTETEEQFYNIFDGFDDFSNYGIIRVSDGLKKNTGKDKGKNIYIISQEKFKVNSGNIDKLKREMPILFSKKKIDIYFDEIHKGGSTERAQENIIQFLISNNFSIDLFVMVTATYAKPSFVYNEQIDTNKPIILNWSYQDQQLMKEISKDSKLKEFLENKNTELERNIVIELLDNYKYRYGENYLIDLQGEYQKHPELVIIQPQLDNENPESELFNLHGNVFKLKCQSIGKTLEELKDPTNIFVNNRGILNLLRFIGKTDIRQGTSEVLTPDCIYGNMKIKYDYDILNTRHVQLWFLPDKNLYDNEDKCREDLKMDPETNMGKTIKRGADEDSSLYEDDDTKTKQDGLPNIEPLSRGLVLNLLNEPFFRDNFCFLIVHNQKIKYYNGRDYTEQVFNNECVDMSVKHKSSLKEIIERFERVSYSQGKSLIILTGIMMRLGISLPCADIAFNFDELKSIDTNYQTMFRVLTERKGKKYGYYFDFYPERAIQFLYGYNEVYGEGLKNSDNMEKLVGNLQSLLYLFNYNGLTIDSSKGNTSDFLELYNKLVNDLKLDKTHYQNRYLTDTKNTIYKVLKSIGDSKELKEFAKYQMDDEKERKTKKYTMKEGTKKIIERTGEAPTREEQDEDVIDIEVEEDDEESANYKKIAEILSIYIPLMALFSNEIPCSNLQNCIETIISNVEKFETFCEGYNGEEHDTLGCYMNLIKGYNRREFLSSMRVLNKFLRTTNTKPIKNVLIIIYDTIVEAMGKKKNLIMDMSSKEIQDKIEEYLPVRKAEKDQFGEVFTPQELINEMLDKLPREVWKNPNLKWLDPANGIGNFPMVVFERLNEGLKTVPGYENDEKRKEYIIENMLYMVELNIKNVDVSRKIFGKKANIYHGSFLEDGWKDEFKIDKFDVIVGNPPWNASNLNVTGTNAGKGTLWDKFIINSFKFLNTNGYLGFIHPSNWRGLGLLHSLWDIMTLKQILYLRIYSKKDGQKLFNVGSRFDIYVLQNKDNTKHTEVIDELGEKHLLKLNELPFLSNYAYKEINKILTTEDKGIDVIYDTQYHTTKDYTINNKTNKYKYPVVHSITQEGIKCWYSNTNTKGHFGIPKVILNFNEHQYSHPEQNDYEGKYGMSQISFGIQISSKREGDLILKAINTPIFKKIIASTKWGAFQTDYRMFKYFKPNWYQIILDEYYKSKSKSPLSSTRKTKTPTKSKSKSSTKKTKTKTKTPTKSKSKSSTRKTKTKTKTTTKSNSKSSTRKTKTKTPTPPRTFKIRPSKKSRKLRLITLKKRDNTK